MQRQSVMAGREPVLERKLLTHLTAAMLQEEDHSHSNPLLQAYYAENP